MKLSEFEEEVAEDFRRLLGLSPSSTVPEALMLNYRKFQKMLDVASAGKANPHDLIMLVLFSGSDSVAEKTVNSAPVKLDPERKPEAFDRVQTVYKGKVVTGEFLAFVDDDLCQVNVDNDSMNYREVSVKDTVYMG